VYIDVPSSATIATDVQLMFNFAAGTGTITRSWNIKIAMLPCGASYLGKFISNSKKKKILIQLNYTS
jgi:hypothetical protein